MSGRRRQYLEAMGIRVWESRRPVADVTPPTLTLPRQEGGNHNKTTDVPPSPSQEGGNHNKTTDVPPSPGGRGLGGGGSEQPRAHRIARMDWEDLHTEVSHCTACPLHATRTQGVFGVGNRQARWMIIGEAPGADEDRLGEPFVGKAGRLLDAMLLSLGLDREQVYIANILKSRPPNNRDPLPEEMAACWPFLNRQIELIRPEIILAVGRIAAQYLLQTEVAVGRLRGRVHRFGAQDIPLIVTYHPAYLLRSPREKRKAWEDLQLARRTLTHQSTP